MLSALAHAEGHDHTDASLGAVFGDAAMEVLVVVPILFAVYLLMEWVTHRQSERIARGITSAGRWGPLVGAVLGAVPQCGFAVMAAVLYGRGLLTVGTLLAVFIATSDEAVPILLAHRTSAEAIGALIAGKVLLGAFAGFAIDLALRTRRRFAPRPLAVAASGPVPLPPTLDEPPGPPLAASSSASDPSASAPPTSDPRARGEAPGVLLGDPLLAPCAATTCGVAHDDAPASARHIVVAALRHTVQISLFLFLVSLAIGATVAWAGEPRVDAAVTSLGALVPAVTALIGLIPNCVASIAVTEMWIEGEIGLGAAFAGLVTSAGLGILALFRAHRDLLGNLAILAGLFAIGVGSGLLLRLVAN